MNANKHEPFNLHSLLFEIKMTSKGIDCPQAFAMHKTGILRRHYEATLEQSKVSSVWLLIQ